MLSSEFVLIALNPRQLKTFKHKSSTQVMSSESNESKLTELKEIEFESVLTVLGKTEISENLIIFVQLELSKSTLYFPIGAFKVPILETDWSKSPKSIKS